MSLRWRHRWISLGVSRVDSALTLEVTKDSIASTSSGARKLKQRAGSFPSSSDCLVSVAHHEVGLRGHLERASLD